MKTHVQTDTDRRRAALLTIGVGLALAGRLARGAGAQHATPGSGGVAELQPGQRVPWPQVRLLDGSDWGAPQADGRAVVLVFWSTTCGFCLRHNPRIEQLHRAARDAGRPLTVLGVATDHNVAEVRRHAASHGMTFPITLDDERLRPLFTRRTMTPMTVTTDRDGRLVQVIPGEMSPDDVMQMLPRLAG